MLMPFMNSFNFYNTGFGYNSYNPFGNMPNLFSFPFMPVYPISIFSYMQASATQNVKDVASSITRSVTRGVSNNSAKATNVASPSTNAARSNQGVRVCNNQNASAWTRLGYCANAGVRLARTALNSAVGFIGYCARYVKNAIAKCGMGEYVSGHAYDMVRIMRNNNKFKEINPAGVNLKSLPAGCVLVYGKGVAGYSKKYGHVEISTGDGKCVSDGITRNPRGVPTAIFMPVSA